MLTSICCWPPEEDYLVFSAPFLYGNRFEMSGNDVFREELVWLWEALNVGCLGMAYFEFDAESRDLGFGGVQWQESPHFVTTFLGSSENGGVSLGIF